MNSLARALRRLADRIERPSIKETLRRGDEALTSMMASEPIIYTGRPRGIPVADRGDALDFDWDEAHGDNPL
jgi:hypothetical protein